MSNMSTTPKIHKTALEGFNTQNDIYENSRPSYPIEMVKTIIEKLSLVPDKSKILDLASGTGKFTRLIEPYHFNLVALEPSIGMREKFIERLPNVQLLEGTAWNIPLNDCDLDALIAAQAFHWFADSVSLKEFARVLKPGGGLCLCWNLENRDEKKWVGELRDIYEKYEQGVPQYRLGIWKSAFSSEEIKSIFTPLQHLQFESEQLVNEETIWQRIQSKSYIARLDKDTINKIKEQIYNVLNSNQNDIERNEDKLIKYPYHTDLYWCFKK